MPSDAPPPSEPLIEAFGMLLETHNELVHHLTRGLDDSGFPSIPWVGVLVRLSRSPDHRLRMTELARDMTMSTSGLTRLIDRVEQSGQVRREACPSDRRGLWCVLTDEGAAVLEAALPQHRDDLRRLIGEVLDPGEIDQLTNLLRRLRDHARSS